VGSADLERAVITELNQGNDTPIELENTENIRSLLNHLDQNMACSACVSSAIHALMRLVGENRLENVPGKLKVGQGYTHQKGPGFGIGTCTSGLDRHVGGCPPSARRIVDFVRDLTIK